MPTPSATAEDLSASLTPSITCRHPDDVSSVVALPGLRLQIDFVDGTSGIVDMSGLVLSDEAGVFAALRDVLLFSQVGVEYGAVTWANGLDLAPDTMYQALRESGEWKL